MQENQPSPASLNEDLESVVPELLDVENSDAPLSDIDELEAPAFEDHGLERPLTDEELMERLDIYLNRMFKPGELLPWKGVTFQVVGIRSGIIGIAVKTIKRQAPIARKGNHRKRSKSRRAKHDPLKMVAPGTKKKRTLYLQQRYKDMAAVRDAVAAEVPAEISETVN